jgi:hypothetical protein
MNPSSQHVSPHLALAAEENFLIFSPLIEQENDHSKLNNTGQFISPSHMAKG